jgi:PTS system ascorbate-specific IIA component
MNVALLLITHEKIASSMIEVTSSIINHQPDNLAYAEIPMDTSVENMEKKIINELDKLNKRDGVLILTDMYGSTPSNIAHKFAGKESIMLVSGLNLPMLIKIMNYRTLPLDELTEKAIDGGQDGIAVYKHGVF